MKTRGMIVSLVAAVILSNTYCASCNIRPVEHIVTTEDQAVEKLGDDIYNRFGASKNYKIGIINFTTLDWKATDVGMRLSNKLSNYLITKRNLAIVERSGLDRIMRALAIEQAGSYGDEKAKRIETKVPFDIAIMGTVSRIGDAMRIEISALNVKTGHMTPSYGARVISPKNFTFKENPEIVSIHEKSPEKLQAMNKSYVMLYWMETHKPLLFLIAVLNEKEIKSIKKTNTILYDKLKIRRDRIKRERPDIVKKLDNLRTGIHLIEKYDSQRYGEIMGWKNTLVKWMK